MDLNKVPLVFPRASFINFILLHPMFNYGWGVFQKNCLLCFARYPCN